MSQSPYAKNKLNTARENEAWSKLFGFFADGDGSKILDVGCSSGNFGKALKKHRRCYVVGVDLNEEDLKLASKNLDKAFKKNIEQDTLSDLGMFDFVVMADVIEHVIDPISVLKKVKKLLKPGGKLIFSVPNMANIANRIELLGGRFEYTEFGLLDETHLHYYDRVEFEKVMSRAGFKVIEYNNTIRDVPEPILLNQLKKLGLKADESFIKMANGLDATTFQFIGVAEPVIGPLARQAAQLKSATPHDFVSRQLDAQAKTVTAVKNQLSAAKDEIKNLRLVQKRMKQEVRDSQRELRAIKNSKGWRLLEKFHTAKHGLKKVIDRK